MLKRMNELIDRDKNLFRLLLIFVLAFLLFSLTKGTQFLKLNTFVTMGKLFPEYGILAFGMALALFIGGIDLSVVYIANLCSIVIAKILLGNLTPEMSVMQAGPTLLLCAAAAAAIGVICGIINGALVAGVGIPPILATLGTQSLFWGISVVITGGSTVSGLPPQLAAVVNSRVLGIPMAALLFLAAAGIVGFIISRTKLGYRLRMLGTNARATTFSGLSNLKLTICNYILIDVLAAVAGILMTGRLSSAKADNGSTYTMQVILIAVMGGIDPNGGRGSIRGVAVAVVIIQMISTWLTMYENISVFYRQIIWGALLLFVLIYNHVNNELRRV